MTLRFTKSKSGWDYEALTREYAGEEKEQDRGLEISPYEYSQGSLGKD